MRRLAAVLALLTFANISIAQVPGQCPQFAASAGSAPAGSHHAGSAHDGHQMPVSSEYGVDQTEGGETHPGCVMTGPCGVSVDAGRVVSVGPSRVHNDVVGARSVRTPPSQTTAPAIPPPRA